MSRGGRPKRGKVLLIVGSVVLAFLALLSAADCWMAGRAAWVSPSPNGEMREEGVAEMVQVDWGYWKEVNPDMVAWIEVPGTQISQPVVQAQLSDPRYYLTHDIYGDWNLYGCPYIDAGCSHGVDSWNVVISGHNISLPPAMFHDLERYHDSSFAREHAEVRIHTPSGTKSLAVVGASTVAGWEQLKRVQFDSLRDFNAYRNELLDEAEVRLEGRDESGQLITLCSCSYYDNPVNERTLVFAQ